MGEHLQILAFIVSGIALLWFGYSLFFGPKSPFYPGGFSWKNMAKSEKIKGKPGDPKVCPLCSVKLIKGENVKTQAFSAGTAGTSRLMHISGCSICLDEKKGMLRRCPVCGIDLELDNYLVSRMFDRLNEKNHVHILGCNHCKRTGNPIKK